MYIQINAYFADDCAYDPFSDYLWIPVVTLGTIVLIFLVRYLIKQRQVTRNDDLPDLTDMSENTHIRKDTVTDVESVTAARASLSSIGLKPKVELQLLATDERKVIEALLNAGGTRLQKDLAVDTGYSRVKIHRILVRLHNRKIVTSEKYYRTKRIKLADWLYDSEETQEK
jgi:uncharacterized membrane protein